MISDFKDFDIAYNFLLNVYKSPVMKGILEKIKNVPLENSMFYIYGENGTEKNYILKLILSRIYNYDLVRIPKDLNKKSFKRENTVYIINDIERSDISFLFKEGNTFKCVIFLEDLDYDILLNQGKLDSEKYNILKKTYKIYLPPLNARKQDIVPIANMLLQEISVFLNLPVKELSKEAKEAITEYSWSHNFYQLKHCLTKACINSKHKKLSAKDIFGEFDDKFSIKNFLESKIGNYLSDFCRIENSNLYDTVVQEVEKALFSLVLAETGNNQLKAAKILGINRNTLSKKLKNYNLI
ncbi:MAG: hypothetical protein N3A00_01105 [Thermodesulfovibrio sp.]|nr:hypothetical protein [Thermodesulfovibrio sp.]